MGWFLGRTTSEIITGRVVPSSALLKARPIAISSLKTLKQISCFTDLTENNSYFFWIEKLADIMQCHLIPQGLIFKKMPFSMELPIFSSTHSPASRVSLRPFVSTCVLYSSFLRYKKFGEKLSCSSRPPLRISMCVLKDCCSLSGDLKGDREVVEVIGIGSRKDAVIDFCLNSNFQSASLRFW